MGWKSVSIIKRSDIKLSVVVKILFTKWAWVDWWAIGLPAAFIFHLLWPQLNAALITHRLDRVSISNTFEYIVAY